MSTAERVGRGPGETLHDRLLDEWGKAIVSGGVPVGDHLPAPTCAVGLPSRTVTREVVRVLESMGLVDVRRKAGVRVRPREHWNIFDPQVIAWRLQAPQRDQVLQELSQLRAGVEPLAARLAAQCAGPEDWTGLTQAAIDMTSHSQHASGMEYLEADERFHRALLKASGNSMFAALGDVIAAVLQGRTRLSLMPEHANEEALRLHSDVAACIRAHEAGSAEGAMRQIVDESDQAIAQLTGRWLERAHG
ncbi:FadR/GntR family transcriptional regulator [Bifidobacterium xylocopae]|uniref:GntR family transcriptional regulator n=1 Tax=Bifidobacterium xylocopae TaxID=2493119 RepID=A0A366KE58_9BIFI|nr:FCD domain-containing protein [Bifidobacterium xylocopae]RBP99488.1 GntR family transcriptional regulator [Bifidobacterium xylocopae]